MNANLLIPTSDELWNVGLGYLKYSQWAKRQFAHAITRRSQADQLDPLVMEGTEGEYLNCLLPHPTYDSNEAMMPKEVVPSDAYFPISQSESWSLFHSIDTNKA
jgi:hypothetical protein